MDKNILPSDLFGKPPADDSTSKRNKSDSDKKIKVKKPVAGKKAGLSEKIEVDKKKAKKKRDKLEKLLKEKSNKKAESKKKKTGKKSSGEIDAAKIKDAPAKPDVVESESAIEQKSKKNKAPAKSKKEKVKEKKAKKSPDMERTSEEIVEKKADSPFKQETVSIEETLIAEEKASIHDMKEKGGVSDFPWEHPDRDEPRVACAGCGEPIHPEAKVCLHCGSPYVTCPSCGSVCAALHNPKMATEQRFNRIFKQYTLFSLALPSLPIQPILDCSCCHNKMILCEHCRTPMKFAGEACPNCGYRVRRTKLLINPLSILDTIFRKPDLGKSIQQSLENFLRSISEW